MSEAWSTWEGWSVVVGTWHHPWYHSRPVPFQAPGPARRTAPPSPPIRDSCNTLAPEALLQISEAHRASESLANARRMRRQMSPMERIARVNRFRSCIIFSGKGDRRRRGAFFLIRLLPVRVHLERIKVGLIKQLLRLRIRIMTIRKSACVRKSAL